MSQENSSVAEIFPATLAVVGADGPESILSCPSPESFKSAVSEQLNGQPAWLPFLAELELAVYEVSVWQRRNQFPADGTVEASGINPGLQIVEVPWSGLVALRDILLGGATGFDEPGHGSQLILVWPKRDGKVDIRTASDDDLLALKLASEKRDLFEVASETGAPVAGLTRLLIWAQWEDLILLPPSRLSRPHDTHPRPQPGGAVVADAITTSQAFVLQWHITQRCDLSCKHCYDRSPRADVTLDDGHALLEQMAQFCAQRRVMGQVSFSGGNPVLHPDFFRLYERAVALGLNVAIIGNPCGAEVLDAMCAIDPPVYYQVSLEGLEEHNNYIRGAGHFQRTLAFLDMLNERGIFSQVMLTLTAANQDQVIPLGRLLAGKTDSFTYNRLAPVGQGASLECAPTRDYPEFLRRYLEAARENPHMGLKDSLFNILLHDEGNPCFGGCTGSGCGAAFNFLSVLGDGAVHACRKMDSPVGNIHESGLEGVYDSTAAARYRAGCAACRGCELRSACGGCLAVAKGLGHDPFVERDPYCSLVQE